MRDWSGEAILALIGIVISLVLWWAQSSFAPGIPTWVVWAPVIVCCGLCFCLFADLD